MFSVYAYKFNPTPESGFQSGDTEQLLFSIPYQNGNRPFLTAVVNNEMGTAGSFEFSVDTKHPYYDIWIHMRTLVRVEYDGDTIFYGRVLTIDRDMYRTRRIHCEGALTFFMDSVFEGKKEGYECNLDEYLQMLIDAHNKCMTDTPEKKIYLGEYPGHYSEWVSGEQEITVDRQKFAKSQGYKETKSWIDELVGDYAGSMRVRYNDTDGKLYLDWMKTYYAPAVSNQILSVQSNVVDLSDSIEVNNIFTHVIPVGKNNKYIDGGGGGGGGGGDGTHTITVVSDPEEGGKAWATPASAKKDSVIELHYAAYAGYQLLRWEVISVSQDPIDISGNKFTMPDTDVTIRAKFQEMDDHGIEPM